MKESVPGKSYMEEALRLAFSRLGTTSPNPPVGAIIVKDGNIISRGATCPYGSDHAEVVAIKGASADLSGASIYVTLEPCCHYGKTPPCTKAIIKSGITKVFVAVVDPNPLVSGKGIIELRENGIEVILLDEFKQQALDLISPFTTYITKKRPHIIHKAAMTLDGCTASFSGDSKWISNEISRTVSHRLRSVVDAVIIGSGTYYKDDPSLSVRVDDSVVVETDSLHPPLPYILHQALQRDFTVQKHSPLRVVMGNLDCFANKNLFFDDNYLIVGRHCFDDLPDYVNRANVVSCEKQAGGDFLHATLDMLFERGIMFAMLEGGASLASSFYLADVIDEFLYFYAPKVVGGGHPLFSAPSNSQISESRLAKRLSVSRLGEDIAVHAYLS